MADNITVSGSSNPYQTNAYSAASNDKNTLDVTSFIKLLAAQLSNQDMTSPMDNSEMMSQMTNMAMVQSLNAMTTSLQTSTTVTTHTYAAGLVGQKVTVAVTDASTGLVTGVKYGIVSSVDFTGGDPVVRLEGDSTDYALSNVLGMGEIPDPFNSGNTGSDSDKDTTPDKDKTPEEDPQFV